MDTNHKMDIVSGEQEIMSQNHQVRSGMNSQSSVEGLEQILPTQDQNNMIVDTVGLHPEHIDSNITQDEQDTIDKITFDIFSAPKNAQSIMSQVDDSEMTSNESNFNESSETNATCAQVPNVDSNLKLFNKSPNKFVYDKVPTDNLFHETQPNSEESISCNQDKADATHRDIFVPHEPSIESPDVSVSIASTTALQVSSGLTSSSNIPTETLSNEISNRENVNQQNLGPTKVLCSLEPVPCIELDQLDIMIPEKQEVGQQSKLTYADIFSSTKSLEIDVKKKKIKSFSSLFSSTGEDDTHLRVLGFFNRFDSTKSTGSSTRSSVDLESDCESSSSQIKSIASSVPTIHQVLNYSNGSRFDGTVAADTGLRHGRSTFTYANGDVYDGGWKHGRRDGAALCEFVEDERNLRSIILSFKDDEVTSEDVSIHYADGATYFGQVTMLNKNDSLKELEGKKLETFLKHGKGEIFFPDGSNYSGTFIKDKMHGFGILCNKEGQYYGNFIQDKRQGYGVMMYENGNYYRGYWKNDIKSGKGDMVCAGCAITGVWSDDQIVKGTYTNLNVDSKNVILPTCSLNLWSESMHNIPDDKKSFGHSLHLSVPDTQLISLTKWSGFFDIYAHLLVALGRKFRKSNLYRTFLDHKRTQSGKSMQEIRDTVTSFETEFNNFITNSCESGDLGTIVSAFDSMFHCRYKSITSKSAKRQKPQALDDFFSFLNTLFHHVKAALPADIFTLYNSDNLLTNLKNYVLSRLYKQLFEIYKFLYMKKDNQLSFKLKSLRSLTMKEFGCPHSSIPADENYLVYLKVAASLSKITNQSCPLGKFKVLKETDDDIVRAIAQTKKINRLRESSMANGTKMPENIEIDEIDLIQVDKSADAKIPIYIYIFVQANIANCYSEHQFMSDFFDRDIATSEYALRYANFEQAIDFVSRIDPSIRDEKSEVIPVDNITERVIMKVDLIFSECRRKFIPQPKLLWLSSVFIAIAAVPALEVKHVLIFEQFFKLFDKYFDFAKIILQQARVRLTKSTIDVKQLDDMTRPHGSPLPSGSPSFTSKTGSPNSHAYPRCHFGNSRHSSEESPLLTNGGTKEEYDDVDPEAEISGMVTTSSLGFSEGSIRHIRKRNEKVQYSYALIIEQPYPSFVYFKFAVRLEEAIARFE